ncbi:hypothetical protein [Leifsonia sp. NPDC080035]|uniref:Uncharacterized protein n=1 Tax=Leifsonia sp. NPDC080035 TaxID=3143936 RepID=A0AAU7GBR5_9MICO
MLRPAVVLWWGIGLTVLGVVLGLALPWLLYNQQTPGAAMDQGMLVLLETAVRLLTGVAPLVGVAMIAAGIVMAYLKRLIERAPEHTFRLRGDGSTPPDAP